MQILTYISELFELKNYVGILIKISLGSFFLDILEIRAAVRAGEEHQRDPPPGGHEEEPGAGHC